MTFVKEKSLPQRLAAIRDKHALSQTDLAKTLGIHPSYISQLESGKKERAGRKVLAELARIETHGITQSEAPRSDIMHDAKIELLRYIPVLTWAQAGRVLVDFDELPKHWQDRIPTDIADPLAVAIEIRGDSMEPHIREGDRVILLPGQDPRNGDIVIAKLVGQGIVIKLYHERNNGKIINLSSFNTLYPPTDYKRSDFERIVPVDSLFKKIRF